MVNVKTTHIDGALSQVNDLSGAGNSIRRSEGKRTGSAKRAGITGPARPVNRQPYFAGKA